MKKVFNDYSKYYDLLYQDKDYLAEVKYIHHLIQQENPGAKTILNLGCGTGKHDFGLVQKGYKITAVDLSSTMIDIARSKKTKDSKVDFFTGDIKSFETNKKFDAVISLFHVVSYQVLNKDLISTFNTAKKHLHPNGVFIFDCWYGPGVLKDPPKKVTKKVENNELLIQKKTSPSTNINENYVDVLFDIEITNKVIISYTIFQKIIECGIYLHLKLNSIQNQ